MNIDIISVLPELMESPLNHSILKRAREKKLINVTFHNLREYSQNKHRQVDDYQFGGGAGMVMKIEPIANCIRSLKKKKSYDEIIFMTPDGKKFTQKEANTLSLKKNLLILAGHYKGIDQRIRDLFITSEISIGDFVLTGGELPSLIIVDAIARLIPRVVNSESSVLNDSFQDNLLSPPLYTRPQHFENLEVPSVLLSGDQKKIDKWRLEKAVEKTKKNRPDLLSD